jgi:hypothetical protein
MVGYAKTLSSHKPKMNSCLLDTTNPDVLRVRGSIIETIERSGTSLASVDPLSTNDTDPMYYGNTANLANAIWTSLCMGTGDSVDQRQTRRWFFSELWTEDGMCQLQPPMHAKILEACRLESIPMALRLWKSCRRIDYSKMMTDREERRRIENEFIDWIEDLGTQEIDGQPLWRLQEFTRFGTGSGKDVLPIIRNLFKVFQNRLNLISTKVGVVGIAHAHVKRGDKICSIAGCSYYLVLRPVNLNGQDFYQLVGDAYMMFLGKDTRRFESAGETFDII